MNTRIKSPENRTPSKYDRVTRVLTILALLPGIVYVPVSVVILVELWDGLAPLDLLGVFLTLGSLAGFAGLIVVLATREARTAKLVLLALGTISYYVACIVTAKTSHTNSGHFWDMLIIGVPYILMSVLFFRIMMLRTGGVKQF